MVKIQVLDDDTDCDQAGCSGGYAEGGRIYIDGVLMFEHVPVASCFDGNDGYNVEDMLVKVIRMLGHVVEVVNE